MTRRDEIERYIKAAEFLALRRFYASFFILTDMHAQTIGYMKHLYCYAVT